MADKNNNRAYEFAMGFVASSEKHQQQFTEIREEVLENFMVKPHGKLASSRDSYSPYRGGGPPRMRKASRRQIVLKDPETHKLVMSYAAKLVRALFSDRKHEYVVAEPVGYEDVESGKTATRLIRRAFALPGHFRTMVEAVIDMLLFGTSVVEVVWKYETREMPVRSVSSEFGVELSETQRVQVPIYDDVQMRVLDVADFYPDPGRYRIEDMAGAAKKFQMNKAAANRMVEGGLWDKKAVRQALSGSSSHRPPKSLQNNIREGLDQPEDRVQYSEFKDLVGYEYWGEVPWKTDSGSNRRVITVWNNEVVRDDAYPLNDPHLPFHTMIINPLQGRFHGISPAEIVRYDQSFADSVKILLAEAIVRRVHPPIAYDSDGDFDLDKLNLWKADVPIGIRGGPNSIGTLKYDADIGSGFALWQGLVDNIQGGSGASGSVQGEEGPDREAATVGAFRIQAAMDRPELAAMVIEEECLPPIAKAFIRRYQQFIEGTEDLKQRIGQLPESVWVGSIMGDFDVTFNGSRRAMSRQMKLQSFDRLVAMATALPPLAARLPLDQLGEYIIGDLLELPEIAGKMSDPQNMMQNIALQQAMGQGGGGQNGTAQRSSPAGALPAQTSGGVP